MDGLRTICLGTIKKEPPEGGFQHNNGYSAYLQAQTPLLLPR